MRLPKRLTDVYNVDGEIDDEVYCDVNCEVDGEINDKVPCKGYRHLRGRQQVAGEIVGEAKVG
jgi:hypothetical protein